MMATLSVMASGRSVSSWGPPPGRRSEGTAERAFGRGHGGGLARIDLDGPAQRPGERLEAALDDVVVVEAVEGLDVERDAGGLGEALEPLPEQLGIHVAQLVAGERHVPDEVRPAGDVESTEENTAEPPA